MSMRIYLAPLMLRYEKRSARARGWSLGNPRFPSVASSGRRLSAHRAPARLSGRAPAFRSSGEVVTAASRRAPGGVLRAGPPRQRRIARPRVRCGKLRPTGPIFPVRLLENYWLIS